MDQREFQHVPKSTRHAIYRDLQRRAVEIVAAYKPEPVLGAEIEAQLTETTPTVTTADYQVLPYEVEIKSAVRLAIWKAVNNHLLVNGERGNQPTFRLPDPIEAGHVTI